jgi:hypothetical protein
MNLQQLIDSRQSLNDLQYQSLLDMLSYRQRNDVREAIKASLRCKFYTIFDQLPLSKKIIVRDDYLELTTKNIVQVRHEVRLLRELVIATGEL